MVCKLCHLGYGCDTCDGDGYVLATVPNIGKCRVECPQCDGAHRHCNGKIELMLSGYRLKMHAGRTNTNNVEMEFEL